jgi:predicted TIM-barrel fold metal-dependent hydrolase
VYQRIRRSIDAVPAIDTHDHLMPYDLLPRDPTPAGNAITLRCILGNSYFAWTSQVEPWPADHQFSTWWNSTRHIFPKARAVSFYRYLLPVWRDLYGVDFDTITDEQAGELNDKIIANYARPEWIDEVVTERANIELVVDDPFWGRLDFENSFPKTKYMSGVLNVSMLVTGHHPSRSSGTSSPYWFAQKNNLKVDTLDDYLALITAIFDAASAARLVGLKSTQAYERTLLYEKVSKDRAEKAFGKTVDETTDQERKDFEDYIFWHLAELSAKYDMPFQIHTGQARVQGSNPMNLANLIEANPRTKFALFHGGYPWVGETGVLAQRFRNVWIDSNWLPQLNYTMAKRAYQEWLDAIPANRILWGADNAYPESVYGATVTMRQCLSEALAEKVLRGELREDDACCIGRMIMRENALELFPKLKNRLWR